MIYVALIAFLALVVEGLDRCTEIADLDECVATEKCHVKDEYCVMLDKEGKKMKKWIKMLVEAGVHHEELEGMDYDGLKKAVKALKKMAKKWEKLGCGEEDGDKKRAAPVHHRRRVECDDLKRAAPVVHRRRLA